MTGGTAPLPPSTRVASSEAMTGASHSVSGAKWPPSTIACGLSRLTTVPSATPSQRAQSSSAAIAVGSPSRARRTSSATGLLEPREWTASPFRPAAASSGSKPARVSRQPREPHAHGSPSCSTVVWPNSPPNPR